MRTLRSLGMALLFLGLLFKTLHWPGASIVLLSGVLLTLVTIVPLVVRRPQPWNIEVRRPGVLFAALVLVLSGMIFKMMHWPGANIMLLLGLSGCAVWCVLFPARAANAA